VKNKKYVKLVKPKFKNIIGHGPMPQGVNIEIDGKKYFLKYDNVFQVSENCKGVIEDIPGKRFSLVNKKFIKNNSELFRNIKINK